MLIEQPDEHVHCCSCGKDNVYTIQFTCDVYDSNSNIWLCLDCLIKAQNLLKNEGVLPCAS